MTKQFINDLQMSPYFQRVLGGRDVIMVFVTGSRLLEVTDERSDYDLVVLTNERQREEYVSEYLTYNSVKVHWSYVPVTKLISNEDGNLLTCIGEVELSWLNDSKIVYENPKYANVIKFLKENKDTIALVGSYGLVRFHDKLVSKILGANAIAKEDHCKFIYHLCIASYMLLSQAPDNGFLAEIKRIRWKEVSDECKRLAVERIRLLHNFVAEHPLDLASIICNFNACVSALLS